MSTSLKSIIVYYQTVTTLIDEKLAFIRLLPHSQLLYWPSSDCYHTHSPNIDLYQTVTTPIAPVLAFIRMLSHSYPNYWLLSDSWYTYCPQLATLISPHLAFFFKDCYLFRREDKTGYFKIEAFNIFRIILTLPSCSKSGSICFYVKQSTGRKINSRHLLMVLP